LRSDHSAIDEARAILRDIVRDSRPAGGVIGKIRLLFKKADIEPRRVSLNRVARDAAAIAEADARLRGVELELALAPGLPIVMGDRVQLQQVVLNLLTNAADAIRSAPADKGHITSHTRELPVPTRGEVELTVADSGPGLPPGIADKVFEPFFSAKHDGMGLGLSISRSIAAAHGGSLTASNGAEGGACFRLSLPAATE